MFAADITSIRAENTTSVIVASVYRGGGDNEPSSHVTRMPPAFVRMNPNAIAVARRICGAALFALHVDSVAAAQ